MTALEDRAIGALIFVFAAPNAMPLPPGASTVLGAPLLFLTAQLALGRGPWLPAFIADRTMDLRAFRAVIARVAPWLARAETLLRPRLPALTRPPAENLIGAVCLLLAAILFLPIPFGNMPPAVALCLFALAILERDGLWVLAGCGVTAASLTVVWGVLYALIRSGYYALGKFLGS